MSPEAVVLLSGGADSATCLALAARREGLACLAVSFDYGQAHAFELEAAGWVAAGLAAEHLIVRLEPRLFRGSALTGRGAIPAGRTPAEIGRDIPATYVPARNLAFLSLAAALAESEGAGQVFIGVNALDCSGYPDCRPEFLAAFQAALERGTRAGAEGRALRLRAPLAALRKAEIFRLGAELGVDYSRTVSCYRAGPRGEACGRCDACLLRARGFAEAGQIGRASCRERV